MPPTVVPETSVNLAVNAAGQALPSANNLADAPGRASPSAVLTAGLNLEDRVFPEASAFFLAKGNTLSSGHKEACVNASCRARIDIRVVRGQVSGAPVRAANWALDSFTSPTGKSRRVVSRYFTGPMPERLSRSAARVSAWPHPMALTTPAPVMTILPATYLVRLAAT